MWRPRQAALANCGTAPQSARISSGNALAQALLKAFPIMKSSGIRTLASDKTTRRRAEPDSLYGRLVIDALATVLEARNAEAIATRILLDTGAPTNDAPSALLSFVRGPVAIAMKQHLGPSTAREVLMAAEALLAGLRSHGLAGEIRPDRGPYVLLGDRPSAFEKAIGLRRVTCPIDLLEEAQFAPTATVVVDAWANLVAPATLAILLEELPSSSRLVVVGASASYRAELESLARRAVTFVDVYEPIGLHRRGAPRPLEAVRTPTALPRAA